MRRLWRHFSLPAVLWLCAAAPRTDVISLSNAKLPPVGFSALPYANPNAPKGGTMTVSAIGGFDNLNPFILQGNAPDSIYLVWQPLFKLSDTDSVTAYAELARAMTVRGDNVTFDLDPRARFSDGTRVTAQDVAWTFRTLVTQGAPFFAGYYADVAGVAAPDAETVVFALKPGAGPDLPFNLAGMYVLPEHFWIGRDFAEPLRVAPVGSGPYRVSAVSFGQSVTYTRVKNWWAEDLPADRGFYNFDNFTEQFFQSEAVALQAFKAGQIDARVEDAARRWADFPQVSNRRITVAAVPQTLPAGMQGLAFNTRRMVFADPRVRRALTLVFDFAWINRVFFHGAYTRETSFFNNSGMASAGPPSAAELKLLAPYRNGVPEAVFDGVYRLPATDGSGDNLPQLRAAMALLNQAGWRVRNFALVNATGLPMRFEILLDRPELARVAIAYAADLQRLGIDAEARVVDPAAYQRRLQDFDFNMTYVDVPETNFPGAEQADYWGCAAARTEGSDNLTGVCSPAVDAMINAESAAENPAAKALAMHALDRLLLNQWIIVPWWTTRTQWLAYWPGKVAKQPADLQVGSDFGLWWAR